LAKGRIVVEFIDGSLPFVIQICNFDRNKPLKYNIKKRYLNVRADYKLYPCRAGQVSQRAKQAYHGEVVHRRDDRDYQDFCEGG
jgi:hypothetical protein